MKKVIGAGVLLQSVSGTYLFQERDHNTSINPGRVTAFGGGIESGESIYECAKRELYEELELSLDIGELESIGLFESDFEDGIYIHMFVAKEIDGSKLVLHEGESIVELSLEEALGHEKVTDFTKDVLRTL